MKKIPAEVKLTPISELYITENMVVAKVVAPIKPKYSSAVYELTTPCIVFASVDDDNEVEVEVRPVSYSVDEIFYFPSKAKQIYIGCDYGLLGGRSKPISNGYRMMVYHYTNAVFPGTKEFCVAGNVSGDNYVVSINQSATGTRVLMIGEEWDIGDNYTIGGYLNVTAGTG